jgi:hypothetical protein
MFFGHRLRKIPVLPIESLAALGPGSEVRVTGTVRAAGDDKTLVAGPITGRLGVYARSEYVTRHQQGLFANNAPVILTASFRLEDGTGTIDVDLTHHETDAVALEVDLQIGDTDHPTFGASILARHASDGGRMHEVVVEVGRCVSVGGILEERDGRLVLAGTNHDPVLLGVHGLTGYD